VNGVIHIEDQRISQARHQHEKRWQGVIFLGLFFNPEDGGDMFL
jgi:hypothetical protein